MYNAQEYKPNNITGATTTQVFIGKGILHSIVINKVDAGTVKIIDGTSGSTANVGTITLTSSPSTQGAYLYDVVCATGLRIVTSSSPDLTITYTTG